jgi:uncharacterized repeat protein (TIGR01451 family)
VLRLPPARWTRLRAGLVGAVAVFLLLGWQGVTTLGRNAGDDAGEHVAYAAYLDAHGHLPPHAVNYEFASPPLFAAVAVAAERVVRNLPSVLVETPWNPLTRFLWLALVVGGVVALTSRSGRLRTAGAVTLGLAALWGLDEAASLGTSLPWSAGQLVALLCGAGLIVVSGLIGREIWPDHPRRALALAAVVAAYPVVYRMSIFFHPEMPFALLCALALLAFLRASRRGWPRRLGWWLGAALGAAAVTRQPAVVVMVVLGLSAIVVGGHRALGFLARAGILVVLIAGPWWGYAAHRWGNPLQSNLEPRKSVMLDHEPASFYVSAPLRSLVVHPFRPDFSNELLPKLHAELWSDWFNVIHNSGPEWNFRRATVSSQSVLGFVGDALALGGLFALAVPAGLRVLRRRSRAPADVGLGVLGALAVVSFVAFVVEIVRFPQQFGDPIKSTYLLFTAPCWAAFVVAAWTALLRRRRLAVALAAFAALYVASYGADLAGALTRTVGSGAINTGGAAGYVDLAAGIQQNSPNPGVGGDIDFLAGVQNFGTQTANNVVLTVRLPSGMRLLGRPFYERGSGCTGTSTITCHLDFLAGQSSTLIRFSVQVTVPGAQTMTATATSDDPDAHSGDNTTSYTVNLPRS